MHLFHRHPGRGEGGKYSVTATVSLVLNWNYVLWSFHYIVISKHWQLFFCLWSSLIYSNKILSYLRKQTILQLLLLYALGHKRLDFNLGGGTTKRTIFSSPQHACKNPYTQSRFMTGVTCRKEIMGSTKCRYCQRYKTAQEPIYRKLSEKAKVGSAHAAVLNSGTW